MVFKKRSGITVELTRRRESKHPPPHQASCERRSRRSRPTICWASPLFARALSNGIFTVLQELRRHLCRCIIVVFSKSAPADEFYRVLPDNSVVPQCELIGKD